MKTQYELEGKVYQLYDVLPQVLETYNFKTVHRTIEMTPADARKSENKMKLQNRYTLIYKEYNPENNRTITGLSGRTFRGLFNSPPFISLLNQRSYLMVIMLVYQHIKVYLIKDIKRIGQWKYLKSIKFKILNQLHIY